MSSSPSQEHSLTQAKIGQDTVRWPSLRVYWRAFWRHFLVAGLWALPAAILVLIVLSQWPKEYTSTAVMLFDPILGRTETQEPSMVLANRVASTYAGRFQDPEFLEKLALRVEEQGFPKPEWKESKLKALLGKFLPEGLQPSSWSLSQEEYIKRERIETLGKVLKTDAIPAQFQLSLSAKGETPDEAQLLAREAVNFFIVEELGKQRDKVQAQAKQLSILESSMLREKSPPGEVAKTEGVRTTEPLGSKPERRQMKSDEQALITSYLAKQAELTRAQGNQVDRRFQLESELNNLLSRKGFEHPDVIQKRREIEKIANDPSLAQIDEELRTMRQKLNELQIEMKRRGIPVDRSVQIASFPDDMRRYLLDVSNQIRNLDLEAENLEEQMNNPSRRTRYMMVREPERPTQASDRKKFLAAAAFGGALVIGIFFLVIVVRELANPRIGDADALARNYALPVAAVAAGSALRRLPFLDTERVRDLRSRLSLLSKKKLPDLALLDSYRYLQQLINRPPQAQVILLLDLGEESTQSSLAANLASVMATDSSDRVLLMSFQQRGQKHLGVEPKADLMAFLGGSVEWKDCRIKSGDRLAFDVALAQDAEKNLDAYREDAVRQLLGALREKYQRILIDGFGAHYLYENSLLWRHADGVILRVFLEASRHDELERLMQLEDTQKIRAVLVQEP